MRKEENQLKKLSLQNSTQQAIRMISDAEIATLTARFPTPKVLRFSEAEYMFVTAPACRPTVITRSAATVSQAGTATVAAATGLSAVSTPGFQ